MKKKRSSSIGKRIIAVMLCAFVVSVSISPEFASYLYAKSIKIQGMFNQTLSEDKSSAIVDLRIEDTKDKTIESITLPDQSKIVKEDFIRDDNNQFIFEYTATENKKLEYVVEYTEKKDNIDNSAEQATPQEVATPEVKKETLTYEIKDIVAPKGKTLDIVAKDITYSVGDKVDLRKGITIKDENDKDITGSLNFDIENYDGFTENIVGSYELTYITQHPVSHKVYKFTRKIAITNNIEAKQITNKAEGSNTTIELSSNNSVFKDPKDFLIGNASQLDFNILVKYQAPIDETERVLKITVPTGFTITKVPSLSQINMATDITTEGNTVILKFADGNKVDVAFEVSIRQDVVALYKEASLVDISKSFMSESISSQNTSSSNFILAVKKFDENNYNFEMKMNYDLSNLNEITSDNYNVMIPLKFDLKAYMKYDDYKIIVPKTINGLEFNSSQSYALVNGVKKSISAQSQPDGSIKVFYYAGTAPGMYFNDYEVLVYLNYRGYIYTNKVYTSQDITTTFNDVKENKGPLVIDTSKKMDIDIQPHSSGGSDGRALVGGVFERINYPTFITKLPSDYLLENLDYVYEFPYELKLVDFFWSGINGTLYTNKGKTFKMGDMIDPVDYESRMEEGEYINKFISKSPLNGLTGTVYAPGESNLMYFDIRETHEDGTPILNGEEVTIKTSIISNDKNIKEMTHSKQVVLTKTEADDLKIIRNSNYDNTKEYKVGEGGYLGGVTVLKGSTDTKIYKNLEIEFQGSEMLSLVDRLELRNVFNSGNEQSVLQSFYRQFKIVYSTNKKENIEKNIDYIDFNFKLEKDEYITKLKFIILNLDPDNPIYNLNTSKRNIEFINLYASSIKKQVPFTGKATEGFYDFNVNVTADGSVEKNLSSTTPTIVASKPVNTLKALDQSQVQMDMNGVKGDYNIYSKGIMCVNFSKPGSEYGAFEFENVEIKVNADPIVLASLTGINKSSPNSTGNDFNVKIRTNLGNEYNQAVAQYNGNFPLKSNEYVTSLTLICDTFRAQDISFIFTGSISKLRDVSYDFIGSEYKSYSYSAEMTASNIEETYMADGKSFSLSGINKGAITGIKKNNSFYPSFSKDKLYQGENFTVTVPNMQNSVTLNMTGTYISSDQYIVDPIYYIEIDKSFVFVANSLKNAEINGVKPNVTFVENKTTEGTSILKIEYHNVKIKKDDIGKSFVFDLMTKPKALPTESVSPIKQIYFDFNASIREQTGYALPSIFLENTKPDVTHIQDDPSKKLYYEAMYYDKIVKINEANEMGIGSIAGADDQIGIEVEGHDNTTFKQELSIISNYDRATKDWIIYVPVPKKDSKVKHQEGTNILESSENEYGLKLAKPVDIPNLPSGATISYTMDSIPKYILDGSDDGGNYIEHILDEDLSKVTMIKIKIPNLEAKQKLFPVIEYIAENDKKDLGKQTANASVYFNMRLESQSDYTNQNGGYAKLSKFNLIDFNVFGKVWEETSEPSNHIFDTEDIKKGNIKVIAQTRNGDEYTADTKQDGTYSIVVPTHGKTTMKVVLPNDITSIPKKEYMFVKENQGNSNTSSVVDEKTGTIDISFNNTDIYNVNAGIKATRAVSVNPKDIVILKGNTAAVPAIAFPSYSVISYQNAADTSIATISSSGQLTGIELGETTATVTIPDGEGKGGVITATYNIKVIPANNPSATFDHITIFQGGAYDATKDIIISDGDKKPISVTDTSKVTINTDAVDTSVPGRYPITYTINDGYNSITETRYVYVHGNIELIVPNDLTKKVGDSVTALDGASASYIHIDQDGTETVKSVPVTTPTAIITSNVATRVNVVLEAIATVDGATDSATGSYQITFNEKAIIDADHDTITVKIGATLDDIKNAIGATASMTTPDGKTVLTNSIDWSFLNGFDTNTVGNTITGKIFVLDPDTGEKIEKEITVTISQSVIINAAKEINLVIGDSFDPFANVTISDGDGNDVTLTADMIVSNNVMVGANGKTTTRGIFEVEYQYTDKYGNTMRAKTTVNVHGQLQFDDTRRDFLQNDSVESINSPDTNKELAYYIDATGNKKLASFKSISDASSTTIGKFTQDVVYMHPVNGSATTFDRYIYVHGQITIKVPNTYTVKVNTEISTLKDVSASYKFVKDDGTIVDKEVPVVSPVGNKTTSAVPTKKTIPVEASTEVVSGLHSNATSSYTVIFNGMPTITVANESIEVRVGATFEEIKNALHASASVQYGDETVLTDLTSKINWDEVKAINTSIKDKTYTVNLHVIDKDGAIAEKSVTIKISNGIIINLPSVDKVVGDSFDPKENVTIFDGQGKPVDLKDVMIDDSNIDMSKPGNYEVMYTYTDSLGNTETKTNTVRVHGKLQFEGLDRIDLIEKEKTYVVNTAKVFYMNNDGKKVYVEGSYDNAVFNQSVVGKNELTYSAVHPINNIKDSSTKQLVFIHGDIVFHKPKDIPTGKVNTTLDPKTGVTATFDFVNDDGTITTKDVSVTSKDITSNKVGYSNGKISAKVEVVEGLLNTKDDTAKVAFNGLPYIEAANTISYIGKVPSIKDIITKMNAKANVKLANGSVVNLTNKINYNDVNRVILDKNGNYEITLTVTDSDGFTTYTVVNVIVKIKPEVPNIPITPTNPTTPNIPSNPQVPVRPDRPAISETPVEKDTAGAVSRDIPLSKTKDGITDDLVKSYISASTENKGNMSFDIISQNVQAKVGTYEATIRLENGTELTVKIKVVDDSKIDVEQPKYGRDDDCIIHWLILLLFAGYSMYSISAMLKRRKDNKELEKALEDMKEYKGDNKNEN